MKLPFGMTNPFDRTPRVGMTFALPKWWDPTMRPETYADDEGRTPYLLLEREEFPPEWRCLSLASGAVVQVSDAYLTTALERKQRIA